MQAGPCPGPSKAPAPLGSVRVDRNSIRTLPRIPFRPARRTAGLPDIRRGCADQAAHGFTPRPGTRAVRVTSGCGRCTRVPPWCRSRALSWCRYASGPSMRPPREALAAFVNLDGPRGTAQLGFPWCSYARSRLQNGELFSPHRRRPPSSPPDRPCSPPHHPRWCDRRRRQSLDSPTWRLPRGRRWPPGCCRPPARFPCA